ncbi:hypothetical protein BH11MYX4_BH11MYX4_27400 [soil metagenome]
MRTLLASCFALSLLACGTASDALDVVEDTRSTALHGTWRSESGVTRPATVTLEQRALSAKLIVSLEGHQCLAESTVEAKVTLDGVETTGEVGGMHLELHGKPGLDDIVGNFAAIEGRPCPGQGGWITVFR